MLGRLGQAYEDYLSDPDYLALRDEIALSKAQIGSAWDSLCELMDVDIAQLKDSDLHDHLTRTASARADISASIEQLRKLADTDAARLKVAHDVLRGDEILAFGHAVLRALREEAIGALGNIEGLRLVGRVQERVLSVLGPNAGVNLGREISAE